MHKNVILSRNKTQETTEQVQKNSRDGENNEKKDLSITVNMMHVTDNRKARKRNWLLNFNLTYDTLWTGAGSGLLISMLEKLNWFRLTGLKTLVLLM